MPPLVSRFLQQMLAFLLSPLFTWLAARGLFSMDESTEYVTELALTLSGLLWMLWTQYKDRLSFLAAWTSGMRPTGLQIRARMDDADITHLAFKDHQP